jgi:hypothetical protein
MFEERMFLPVQREVSIHEKGWNPLRATFIEIIIEFNEALDLRFVFRVNFFDAEHENLLGRE